LVLSILIHLPPAPGGVGLMLATSNSSKFGLGADCANTPLAITTKTATLDFKVSDMVRPLSLTVDQESSTHRSMRYVRAASNFGENSTIAADGTAYRRGGAAGGQIF
jgi:hypothetical protein